MRAQHTYAYSSQVTVLTGPVKSGKTDVLHLLLPSIIAQVHSASKRRPLIMRFTFNLGHGPEMAALALLQKAQMVASSLGISIPFVESSIWALNNFPEILGGLARDLTMMNAELWLLMDECQV